MTSPRPSPRVITELPRLLPRPLDSHKGNYGRVVVIAGSRGMTGAAVLAGSGALRGGAGLVQVACPIEVQDLVAAGNPCFMTCGLTSSGSLKQCIQLAETANVLAIGSGLGTGLETAILVMSIIESLPSTPIVLDADGIRALSPLPDFVKDRSAPMILTPHPGEFAGLLKMSIADVQANREELAAKFAQEHEVVLLLKGHRTIITDGERIAFNPTGNPGMATGGSGDVLTGLIAALIAQQKGAFQAAQLGAWLHGRAGDYAARDLSQAALIASDLLTYLPRAFREIEQTMPHA